MGESGKIDGEKLQDVNHMTRNNCAARHTAGDVTKAGLKKTRKQCTVLTRFVIPRWDAVRAAGILPVCG
jgi:hypothetical protein